MSHPGCGPLFWQPEQINLTVDEVRAPGLIHTLDRVCSPYGKPGVDGSHQGTECQATVPGRTGQAPLTPAVPFLVLSHQLRAAVEPLDTNAAGQPDMGPAVSCTPSPIAEHGMPTETLLETQLHTPKGWALTPRGRPGLLGWEGRSPPTCRLAALSTPHRPPQKAPGQSVAGPCAACATTRSALLSPHPCLSLHPTPVLSENVHKLPANKTLAPVLL